MSEFMGQLPKKIEGNAHKFAVKHLEQLGIQPEFVQENNPQFEDMRKKLNTESGVIICNHPGWGDTFMIFSAINRDDIKVMMDKNYFNSLPTMITDKYFFSNEKDPHKTIGIFRKIQDHIKNGGIFLTYPSGGNEKKTGTNFEDGFRVILRELKPEQMVYCFNINNDDVKKLDLPHSGTGLASEVILPALKLKKARSPKTVRVDEAHTQAGDWQKAIESISKKEKGEANGVLTEKYESMFLQNR